MKNFNNEITVHRGETFTLNKNIQNRDGSPYIISSELSNPYFLLTVTTTRYKQENRYILSKWLDLSDFPRFYNTTPMDLWDIKSSAEGYTPKYTTLPTVTDAGIQYSYNSNTHIVTIYDKQYVLTTNDLNEPCLATLSQPYKEYPIVLAKNDLEKRALYMSGWTQPTTVLFGRYVDLPMSSGNIRVYVYKAKDLSNASFMSDEFPLQGYINGELCNISYKENLYQFVDDKDNLKYQYLEQVKKRSTNTLLDPETNMDSYYGEVTYVPKDYECRIITQFIHDITKNWMEQSYVYSINLVSGPEKMLDYLRNTCNENGVYYSNEMTAEQLKEKLIEAGVEITVNPKMPITYIDVDLPILTPTKLSVLSDLQGGL